jgi:amidase
MDTVFTSATALALAIRQREVSASEVLEAHLAQIAAHNAALQAVVTLDTERARRRARDADAALARNELWGPLHGVPFTLKDAFATAGVRTTTGVPFLDHVPAYDSTVAARLKAAGGVLLGKTNVAAMLGDPAQSANPIFGHTSNPWDVTRTPGGSSGGAAVASGMSPFDVGTDFAGSIRIPAHFCGVYGLKPTERRVSLDGLLPGLPPPRSVRIMSCIGPIARSAEDLALVYRIIAGPDGRDTEVPPVPLDAPPAFALAELRIAVAPTLPGLPVNSAIRDAVNQLAQQLQQTGAVVEEAPLPTADVSEDLLRAGVLIGMLVGASEPSEAEAPPSLAQYLEALHQRDQAIVAWEQFFASWDVLLCPAAMTTAFPHCAPGTPLDIDGQQESYWAISGHTTLFNYTGHPALVVPYTHDSQGLPLGLQLVGKRWDEARLLAITQALGAVLGSFRRPPGL